MKQRIITATIALAVFIPILVLSNIYSDLIVLSLTIAALSVIGVYEMLKCIGVGKKCYLSIPAYLLSVAGPVLAFILREKQELYIALFLIVFALYLAYLFACAVLSHSQNDEEKKLNFANVTETFVSVFYITFGFTSLILTRYMYFGEEEYGKYYYLLAFIGAWVTDTFAYFAGRAFGKHKLSPEISPKKTVEGSIGGTLMCVIAFIIFSVIVGKMTDTVSVVFVIIMAFAGLIVAVVSQIGDLIASLVKREHGIKDYGNLFPGHGGVMDRFDSILGSAPILFAVMYLIKILNIFS